MERDEKEKTYSQNRDWRLAKLKHLRTTLSNRRPMQIQAQEIEDSQSEKSNNTPQSIGSIDIYGEVKRGN